MLLVLIYAGMLAAVAGIALLIDAYPAEFFACFLSLIAVVSFAGGWSEARPLRRWARLGGGLRALAVVAAAVALIVLANAAAGLLGMGADCNRHSHRGC